VTSGRDGVEQLQRIKLAEHIKGYDKEYEV
jgi:hypothetical protein